MQSANLRNIVFESAKVRKRVDMGEMQVARVLLGIQKIGGVV